MKASQSDFAGGYVEGYERGYRVGVLDVFSYIRMIENMPPQWEDEEQDAELR